MEYISKKVAAYGQFVLVGNNICRCVGNIICSSKVVRNALVISSSVAAVQSTGVP